VVVEVGVDEGSASSSSSALTVVVSELEVLGSGVVVEGVVVGVDVEDSVVEVLVEVSVVEVGVVDVEVVVGVVEVEVLVEVGVVDVEVLVEVDVVVDEVVAVVDVDVELVEVLLLRCDQPLKGSLEASQEHQMRHNEACMRGGWNYLVEVEVVDEEVVVVKGPWNCSSKS
jgi:hypothetical protein